MNMQCVKPEKKNLGYNKFKVSFVLFYTREILLQFGTSLITTIWFEFKVILIFCFSLIKRRIL